MPVVKQVDARHLIRDALVLDLGDLRRQAQEIIDDAERRAAALLADAGAEAKRLVDGAHAEGHAAGLEQGRADGLAEGRETGRAAAYAEGAARSADVGAAWAAALDHWERHRAEMLFAAREDVVALATAIAEKVIFRAVAADPTIIEDQLAEA
ncbi:MAG: hypothetical protein KDA25_10965, partial [Phycisphaerales bacterium]|nr:hypothetical protein [Phycisphaerales bacterium]